MHSENHAPLLPFDGYVRVSDRAGREGDSFLSPKIQRETIERLAAFNGITLGEIVEEMDVSGGKKVRDRELGRLVEKIEAGESGGLIVWKLTRFSRNMLDSVETAMRITRRGGRLLADDFDTANSYFKPFLGLLAGMAEEELDARREGWRAAKANAVGRGIHISANAPFGYMRPRGEPNPRTGKRPTLPLVPDPETAWAVAELFHRRAVGESWGQMRQFLVANNLPTVRGANWATSTLGGLIKNRVYLGEARGAGDGHVTVNAHEPLIDEATWQAAQDRRGARYSNLGGSPSVLRGLIRCGGCRYVMQSRQPASQHGAVQFVCNSRVGCANAAVVTAIGMHGRPGLDHAVVEAVRDWERENRDRLVFQGVDPALDVSELDQEIAELEAQREKDALDPEFAKAMGAGRNAALAKMTAQIEALKAERQERLRQLGGPANRPYAEFWEDYDSGEVSAEEMRGHLASMIQAVFVKPDGARGVPKDDELRRRWFAGRVEIVWVNDDPLSEIPRQGFGGYRIKPWPFADTPDSDPDELGAMPLQPKTV